MQAHGILLVPFDFSTHAKRALDQAEQLARRLDARIHLVHVVQPPFLGVGITLPGGAAPASVDVVALHDAALDALREVAEARGLAPEIHVVQDGSIANGICALAEKLGAELIVMGTHGRTGMAHVFLGSVAERTLRQAPCPVVTVRAAEDEPA